MNWERIQDWLARVLLDSTFAVLRAAAGKKHRLSTEAGAHPPHFVDTEATWRSA